MNTFLIKTVSDIEMLIGDLKTRIVPEEEFKKKLCSLAQSVLNDAEDESIDRDLEAGKKVMGHMKNPITGQIEEVSKTGFICQLCGKHWLWGAGKDGDTFFCPDCSKRTDELVLGDYEQDDREKCGLKPVREAY